MDVKQITMYKIQLLFGVQYIDFISFYSTVQRFLLLGS